MEQSANNNSIISGRVNDNRACCLLGTTNSSKDHHHWGEEKEKWQQQQHMADTTGEVDKPQDVIVGEDDIEKRVQADEQQKCDAQSSSSSPSSSKLNKNFSLEQVEVVSTKKNKAPAAAPQQQQTNAVRDEPPQPNNETAAAAASIYQRRRELGFRDLGLLAHIQDCQETRAALKAVGDPEELRKKKIEDFIEEFKRTKPRGNHTHGISEYEVKETLQSLKQTEMIQRKRKEDYVQGSGQSIEEMKSKLRPANSEKNVAPTLPKKKKWSPPPKDKTGNDGVGYSPSPMQTMFGNMGSSRKQQQPKRRCTAHRIPHLEPASPIKMPKQDEKGLAPVAVTGNIVVIPEDAVPTLEQQQRQDDDDDDVPTPTNQFKMQRAKLRSTRKHHPQVVSHSKINDGGSDDKQQQEIISTAGSITSTPYQEMRQKLKPAALVLEKLDLVTATSVDEKSKQEQQANDPLLLPSILLTQDSDDVERRAKDNCPFFCGGNGDDDDDDDAGCGVAFLARFLPSMILPILFRTKESVIA